eukprot:CAMPEP_0180680886 /NCGR_PEP_ID=MMETSP1037_2-20121125/69710_1 /TAXON_ID=632150 /ORGANISM="Azadinium spinosum, Strain 3D9" /LENGTH=205 /DNA_ID=CAMNT_0022710737 /DNA_START=42 /DNA_END=655 /DNA_ORIENTATION=-
MSGGGSRALSAGLGQFRALHKLGLLPNVDMVSSVSGGTWASSILMFAPMDLDALLGQPTNPSQLTMTVLDRTPAPLGAVVMAEANSIAMSLKFSGVPMGNLWTSTVAKAFLEPFGLNQLDAFLAPSQAAVSQIIARNPQYRGSKFLVPQQEGRPKNIVMSSTVEAPDGYKANVNNVASLQVGPDFAGTPFYPNNEPVSYASASAG